MTKYNVQPEQLNACLCDFSLCFSDWPRRCCFSQRERRERAWPGSLWWHLISLQDSPTYSCNPTLYKRKQQHRSASGTRACFQWKLQDQMWLQLRRQTRRALSGQLISFCFGICYFLGVLSAHASLFFSTGLCAAKNAMLHKGKEASPSVSKTLVRPKCDPLSIEFAKPFGVPHV